MVVKYREVLQHHYGRWCPTHSTIYVAFNSFGVTGRWKGYQGIGRQDCIRHGYVNVPATCTYTISMHKR